MKENRVDTLKFRASPREISALKRIADHEGRSLSETLRELIREAAERRGFWPTKGKDSED